MSATDVLGLSPGAQFLKADLHVHTPGSRDMASAWQSATAEEVVAMALSKELEVIAIADHNTVEWCDPVREAATNSTVAVFPGVELTTAEGHLLAIFDPHTSMSELRAFLVQVGIREPQYGDLNAVTQPSDMVSVATLVQKEGGLAIPAHVDASAGFMRAVRSGTQRQRIYASQSIDAVEIVNLARRAEYLGGQVTGYPRHMTCLQGSDCWPPSGDQHQLDAMGTRHSFLKMDEHSLWSLRQVLLDPEARVRLMGDPMPQPATSILGMWVTGGFLTEQRFRFSPDMTCLIGGTGSGKSLSLELIRFGLEQQVDERVLPSIAKEVANLLISALRPLDTVHILVQRGADIYVVQRTWEAVEPPPSQVEKITDGSREPIANIHLPSFFPITAFSQSEIIEYAREPLARLTLIDPLLDLGEIRMEVERTKGQLTENSDEMLRLLNERASKEESAKELPGVEEEIGRLQAFLQDPQVLEHDKWYREEAFFGSAQRVFQDLDERIEDMTPHAALPNASDGNKDSPNQDLVEGVSLISIGLSATLAENHRRTSKAVAEAISNLASIRADWQRRFDVAERDYRRRVAELGDEAQGQAALHSKLAGLRERQSQLGEVRTELTGRIASRLHELESERDELLERLQRARRSRVEKRRSKAAELTDALDDRVRINMRADRDRRQYRDGLRELRRGSYVRDAEIEDIATNLHPIKLVKGLLGRDLEEISSVSGVSQRTIEKLCEVCTSPERIGDLYALQTIDTHDVVEVQFRVDDETYRDLEGLAHGQKCTAVLMIALAEGDGPLLVDQPEDALHAPWIEDYIAPSLRGRRGRRQFLFATRSANVLVSADAEQVIAMNAEANRGWIEESGSIDRFAARRLILYHVEGGEPAFLRRQLKYGLQPPT